MASPVHPATTAGLELCLRAALSRDVHIDACELRSAEGKDFLFLAIDRVSKFTYVELHPAANMATGAAFLRSVIEAFPYRIHTLLTDNGTPFADQPRYRSGPTARLRGHATG